MTKRLLGLAALLLLLGSPARARGPAKAATGKGDLRAYVAAMKSAEAWLALVDGGHYGESWDAAASLFRAATTRDAWAKAVGAVRAPFGEVRSRKNKGAEYKTSLPGAPDGAYVVIQFSTSFENKKTAVETVTPMREADGSWKVSGYFVK